ncbi:MAG: hypothetical protein ACXVRV_15675 [Gaiellaceae bacterium]
MSSTLTEKMANDEGGETSERAQALALKQIKRVRNLKFHLTAFLVGTVMLGGPWVVVEYVNAGGWPQRFNGNDQAGSWDPFVPAVLVVWALFVALRALELYFRRPPSEQDLARAVRRLQHR